MLAVFFAFGFAIIHVQAARNDASVDLKKDRDTGLFILTIKDPDGIQEFSLYPVGEFRYGGILSGCKKSFVHTTVRFVDPDNFMPVMPAEIVDCKNNTTKLEIPPPVDGIPKGVALKKEEPPPPPTAPPTTTTQEKKKSGPS